MNAAPHVDRGVGDVLSLAAVRLQKRREAVDRRCILAVGDIDDLATDHVHEQTDVVVAAARRGLVRRDLLDLAEIEPFNRPRNVMIEHSP